jgi:ribose/xylose/arabinose/galactoside ABC-type transport system permease subunit
VTAAERVDRTSFEHLRRLTRRHSRKATLLIVLVVLIVVFSLLSSDFLTSSNLLSTARRGVEIGLISMAMAVVIGSGGIDLSVGSIVALSSVTIGYSHARGMPLVASLVLGFGVAAACGAFNGLLIATLGLHPLVVTIGTLALYSGLALGISSGGGYSQFPDWFQHFGQSYFGIFPGQLIVWVMLGVLTHIAVTRTIWGRHVLTLGTSREAAHFSGVRVRAVTMSIYTFSGVMSGLAAIIYTSRVFSARGDAGTGLELQAIAAVVVGGASITGGAISIPQTAMAVIVIGAVPNGLALAGVDTNWQYVVIGAVMVFAVALNQFFGRRGELDASVSSTHSSAQEVGLSPTR